ncbi:D-arabinono-1,4-lactone oxidase [Tepidicaulis sp. LMO-SS28]|uniref:D-arabinono-1,4-lactone oxidase n=1 Tax=Tepidicaulis sp. LMO-SS28 TaxID=3447455 RepID=UPI003EE0A068
MAKAHWQNWSGWVTANPKAMLEPGCEEELADQVRGAAAPLRAAGAGHSFTPVAQTGGTLFSLRRMSGIERTDRQTARACIKAGTSIRALGPLLHEQGLGLLNQGDIDAQSIAGAVGTGTHGTGAGLSCISGAVTGFRLVTATGDVLTCSEHENTALFEAGRVSLGLFGIMSAIEMQCRTAYALEETGGRMALEDLFANIERLRDENRHFEFFWFPHADEAYVKLLHETDAAPLPKERVAEGEEAPSDAPFRAACELSIHFPSKRGALQKLMAASGRPLDLAAPRRGRAHWSHDAFPSDRTVRFNEMEYAVPAENGPDCVREVGLFMRKAGYNFLFPLEFRFVKGDDIWLSPFEGRDSATIAVHQYFKQPYAALFREVEQIFRRYGGRPHWGKLHTRTANELRTLYPRYDDFVKLRRELDPKGRFLTPYLETLFG